MRDAPGRDMSDIVSDVAVQHLSALKPSAAAATFARYLSDPPRERSVDTMQKLVLAGGHLRLPAPPSAARAAALWAAALPHIERVDIPAGTPVVTAGDTPGCAYWLLTGSAKVSRAESDGSGSAAQGMERWQVAGIDALQGQLCRFASLHEEQAATTYRQPFVLGVEVSELQPSFAPLSFCRSCGAHFHQMDACAGRPCVL